MNYDSDFYAELRDGAQRSAAVVVPLVAQLLTGMANTVVDVGGGEGWWAGEFKEHGYVWAANVNGAVDTVDTRLDAFHLADFEDDNYKLPDADLGICLEVIEHLSLDAAWRLLDRLAATYPYLLFSGAVPGQPGAGHNQVETCRWPTAWAGALSRLGYVVSGFLRFDVWDDDRVEPWYRQNMLLGISKSRSAHVPTHVWDAMFRDSPPLNVVHPQLWESLCEAHQVSPFRSVNSDIKELQA